MSADTLRLLTALQFADSAFPSGGFAFSWGLEGLQADGLADSFDDVAEIVAEQLRQRWATMDRILLARAHAASGNDELADIDAAAEVACTSEQLRTGSRRAGRALIGMAARLDYPGALSYRAVVRADERLGHLPVVQGLVFRDAGLDGPTAEVVSAWSLLNGLTSAAIRLGLIGHVQAQHLAIALRPVVAALLDGAADLACPLSSFTPLIDIAVSRRGRRDLNLFAT
jgi:urease accessory protein